MIEQLKLWALILLPLWLLVFYDIYKSKNTLAKKIILALLNLVLLQIGSLLYILAAYLEGEKSFVLKEFKRNFKIFKGVFTKTLTTLVIVDVLLIIAVGIIGFLAFQWFSVASAHMEEKTQLDLIQSKLEQAELDSSLETMMQHSIDLMRGFLIKTALLAVVLVLILLLVITYAKCWQWSFLTKHRLTKKYFWKSYLLNCCLCLLAIGFFLFVSLFVRSYYHMRLFIIAIVLALYFGYKIQYHFIQKPGLKAIGKGLGLSDIKSYCVPYTVLAVLFFVMSLAYALLSLIPVIGVVIAVALLLCYFAVARLYFVRLQQHFQNE